MQRRYSTKEEVANAVSHGLGTLLGITGLVLLLVYSVLNGTATHIVSSAVYGTTLIILYLVSTLYHAIPNQRAKSILQKLDHLSIFLFIAGSYTPFTLISLKGGWGWSLFGVVWGLALAGILIECFSFRYKKLVSLSLYVIMGWLIIIALRPMLKEIDTTGFIFFVQVALYILPAFSSMYGKNFHSIMLSGISLFLRDQFCSFLPFLSM